MINAESYINILTKYFSLKYPKLKTVSLDTKDPYYPWDYPEHKRNFNDPMHAESDLYSEERYSTGMIIFDFIHG